MVDWKGIVRELRLLVTELQRDRFYALYILLVFVVVCWVLPLTVNAFKR